MEESLWRVVDPGVGMLRGGMSNVGEACMLATVVMMMKKRSQIEKEKKVKYKTAKEWP